MLSSGVSPKLAVALTLLATAHLVAQASAPGATAQTAVGNPLTYDAAVALATTLNLALEAARRRQRDGR